MNDLDHQPLHKKKKLELAESTLNTISTTATLVNNSAYNSGDYMKFHKDNILEILSFIPMNNVQFIVLNLGLVSKEWMQAIVEYSKLDVQYKNDEIFEGSLMNSRFLQNIESLHAVQIVSNKLLNIVGLMKNLTKLDISKRVEMKGLRHQITKDQIGVTGAEHIGQFKQLTILNISNNNIRAEGSKFISKLDLLTDLNIGYNEIGNEGVKWISEMNNLTSLNIRNNSITNIGDLGRLNQLTFLSICWNFGLELEGVKSVCKGLKKLTNFHLARVAVDWEAAKCISEEMKQLTHLDINSNFLDAQSAEFLCKMENLIKLNLDCNDILDEGASYISNMNQLTSLSLLANELTLEGLKHISGMTRLEALNIGCNDIDWNAGLHIISTNMKQLTKLDIRRNNQYNKDIDIEAITKMTNLNNLDIIGHRISFEQAKIICNMPSLRTLRLSCNISQEQDEELHNLKQWEKLDIKFKVMKSN